ncbi:spore germination protein [Paenibacillus sp. SI8]|uniref:spore germination protein n=1 Tax=unclassified Paenibacillus TaxID=185978 RepID=UPI003465AF94
MRFFVSEGDVVVVHSMDRLARNLDDLRKIIQDLTKWSVRIGFVKENMRYKNGSDSKRCHVSKGQTDCDEHLMYMSVYLRFKVVIEGRIYVWERFRKKGAKQNQVKLEITELDAVDLPLDQALETNLAQIKQRVGNSPDIVIREFEFGGNVKISAATVYTDGLADKQMVSDFVKHSLNIDQTGTISENMVSEHSMFHFVKNNALSIEKVEVIKDWNGLILSILSGDTAILIDGWPEAIIGNTRGGETRSISEPTTQVVIRGPKDSFSESIGTNISLVRRRIKSPNLWLETMQIGTVTQTDVAVMYVKGIANEQLVQEAKQRLHNIKIDGILESGYIEELIQDQTFTPFPTVYNTERPDVVAANLLEGRIAIMVDGTPYVLIAPTTFFSFFQSAEDYYNRFDIAIAIRLLRYMALFLSLLGPSIYIAAVAYHQEMIPTPLLISLAAQREGVPFPMFIEALMMEISFELLREAGVRMPRAVGQAVSIVGALILGQAAVQAGIVSAAMVIVVATTGIASFATGSYSIDISVRLLRFVIMIFAGTFGFYGIAIISIIIIAHLCSLRSFGVPFMAPLAPFIAADQKDAVLRLPIWSFLTRPRLTNSIDKIRMGRNKPTGDSNES